MYQSGSGGAGLRSSRASSSTNATHEATEHASRWVTIDASAVSSQSVALEPRGWSSTTGAIRISAPLPALSAPQRYQGTTPCVRFCRNCPTDCPTPKISCDAKRAARSSGSSPPRSSRLSTVRNASWLSSEGRPTRRPSARQFGQ